MKARIVIPVAGENGLDSRLAEHFGRAPYFAVVDLDEKGEVSKVEIVQGLEFQSHFPSLKSVFKTFFKLSLKSLNNLDTG